MEVLKCMQNWNMKPNIDRRYPHLLMSYTTIQTGLIITNNLGSYYHKTSNDYEWNLFARERIK